MQILRAVLAGQHPSGKNQIQMRPMRGWIQKYPKASFEAWRGTGYAQLDRQRGTWETLRTPAKVTVLYTPGDLLRRDVPGMIDALCHLLEFCPIHRKVKKKDHLRCSLPFVADDVLLAHWDWTTMPLDRENPRIEMRVEHYANGKVTK